MVILTTDAAAAGPVLASEDPASVEVHVVTTLQDLDRIARLGLRRRDRVLWLDGWSQGTTGHALAARAETAAATGAFGTARHGFGSGA